MVNNSDNYSVYDDKLLLDQIAYGGATPEEGQKRKKAKSAAKAQMKNDYRRWFTIGIIAVVVGAFAISTLPFGLINFILGPAISAGVFGIVEGIYRLDAYDKKQQEKENKEQQAREKRQKQEEKEMMEYEQQLANLELKQSLSNMLNLYAQNSKTFNSNNEQPVTVQDPSNIPNNNSATQNINK